jgi:two-component system, response regulator RegA
LRVLLAQTHGPSSAELARFLESKASTRSVHCIESARFALEMARFDAVFLDLALSEPQCLQLLESIAARPPMPAIFVIASSEPAQVGFRLAQLGVRAVLRQPFEAQALERVWRDALDKPPDLRPLVRSSVGLVALRKVEGQVRTEMIAEALARTQGSRRGAAAMLSISRQLLQHIVRNDDEL